MLRLCLGQEAVLPGRDHLKLDALQQVALAEVGEALEQDAALSALADALHLQAVPLDAGARALMHLRRTCTSLARSHPASCNVTSFQGIPALLLCLKLAHVRV